VGHDPFSSARMYMELWEQPQAGGLALVSEWDFSPDGRIGCGRWEKHYRLHRRLGRLMVWLSADCALGAALAHRDAGGRVSSASRRRRVHMAPHTLWTARSQRHSVPDDHPEQSRLITRRSLHVQRLANRHNRGLRNVHIVHDRQPETSICQDRASVRRRSASGRSAIPMICPRRSAKACRRQGRPAPPWSTSSCSRAKAYPEKWEPVFSEKDHAQTR